MMNTLSLLSGITIPTIPGELHHPVRLLFPPPYYRRGEVVPGKEKGKKPPPPSWSDWLDAIAGTVAAKWRA
jgi:hypothetical protein